MTWLGKAELQHRVGEIARELGKSHWSPWTHWLWPLRCTIAFEGENFFIEIKTVCHVSFVSFWSLDGFILFNEPVLLAGFLKLFSKA